MREQPESGDAGGGVGDLRGEERVWADHLDELEMEGLIGLLESTQGHTAG